MKKIKKWVTAFMITFMVVIFLPQNYNVKAATTDLKLDLSSSKGENLKVNDELEVNINIELPENKPDFVPGITAIGLAVSYDSSILQFVSGTPGTAKGIVVNDFEKATVKKSDKNIIISYSTAEKGIVEKGLFYTIKFKALSVPENGKTNINVLMRTNPDGGAIDYDLKKVGTTFLKPNGIDLAFDANVKSSDADKDSIVDSKDTDDDNDGILDEKDAFPTDSKESKDTDMDGIGDNSDKENDLEDVGNATNFNVKGVENGKTYNKDVDITFEGEAKLDGENFTSGNKVTKEGEHELVVTDKDKNKQVIKFKIDKPNSNSIISYWWTLLILVPFIIFFIIKKRKA